MNAYGVYLEGLALPPGSCENQIALDVYSFGTTDVWPVNFCDGATSASRVPNLRTIKKK